MKRILQDVILFSLIFYFVSLVIPGLKITGGIQAYLISGIVVAAGYAVIRPLFTILTLPLILLSMGIVSYIGIAIILFVTTLVYSNFQVSGFSLSQVAIPGVILPHIFIPRFLSFFVLSVIIEVTRKILRWIFE